MARTSSASARRRTLTILRQAKTLAREYRELTGKPLGITGEVAELEAARLLRLDLSDARQAGYDATERRTGRRLQIKGRCRREDGKPGQMMGSINTKQKDWDAVLLVILTGDFSPDEIYEANRAVVERALKARGPGLRVRNDMHISKFKKIGTLRWRKPAVARRSAH